MGRAAAWAVARGFLVHIAAGVGIPHGLLRGVAARVAISRRLFGLIDGVVSDHGLVVNHIRIDIVTGERLFGVMQDAASDKARDGTCPDALEDVASQHIEARCALEHPLGGPHATADGRAHHAALDTCSETRVRIQEPVLHGVRHRHIASNADQRTAGKAAQGLQQHFDLVLVIKGQVGAALEGSTNDTHANRRLHYL